MLKIIGFIIASQKTWQRERNEPRLLVSSTKADLKEILSLWIKLANKCCPSPIPKHYWLHIKCHSHHVHESREAKALYNPPRDCIVAIIITTRVVQLIGRDTNYGHLARGNSLHFYYSPLLATNFPLPTHINPAWQAIRIKVSIRSCSHLRCQWCIQQSAIPHVEVVTCRKVAYSSWSPVSLQSLTSDLSGEQWDLWIRHIQNQGKMRFGCLEVAAVGGH